MTLRYSNGLKVCCFLKEKRLFNLKHVVHSSFFNVSTGVHVNESLYCVNTIW